MTFMILAESAQASANDHVRDQFWIAQTFKRYEEALEGMKIKIFAIE